MSHLPNRTIHYNGCNHTAEAPPTLRSIVRTAILSSSRSISSSTPVVIQRDGLCAWCTFHQNGYHRNSQQAREAQNTAERSLADQRRAQHFFDNRHRDHENEAPANCGECRAEQDQILQGEAGWHSSESGGAQPRTSESGSLTSRVGAGHDRGSPGGLLVTNFSEQEISDSREASSVGADGREEDARRWTALHDLFEMTDFDNSPHTNMAVDARLRRLSVASFEPSEVLIPGHLAEDDEDDDLHCARGFADSDSDEEDTEIPDVEGLEDWMVKLELDLPEQDEDELDLPMLPEQDEDELQDLTQSVSHSPTFWTPEVIHSGSIVTPSASEEVVIRLDSPPLLTSAVYQPYWSLSNSDSILQVRAYFSLPSTLRTSRIPNYLIQHETLRETFNIGWILSGQGRVMLLSTQRERWDEIDWMCKSIDWHEGEEEEEDNNSSGSNYSDTRSERSDPDWVVPSSRNAGESQNGAASATRSTSSIEEVLGRMFRAAREAPPPPERRLVTTRPQPRLGGHASNMPSGRDKSRLSYELVIFQPEGRKETTKDGWNEEGVESDRD